MDSSRAGRSNTNSEPPGVFGETRSHECRSFLVPHWDVANLIPALAERFIELIPSPTIPKAWVAPQLISVSTIMSAVFRLSSDAVCDWGTTFEAVSLAAAIISAARAGRGASAAKPAAAVPKKDHGGGPSPTAYSYPWLSVQTKGALFSNAAPSPKFNDATLLSFSRRLQSRSSLWVSQAKPSADMPARKFNRRQVSVWRHRAVRAANQAQRFLKDVIAGRAPIRLATFFATYAP
jgi:hypothetical protein